MLTGKCQETLGLLLTEDDFNIRLTIAKNATAKSRFTQKSVLEGIFKEYIRDSIGEILNTNILYMIDYFIVKNSKVEKISATLLGNEILNRFWDKTKDANGIRITITQANGKELSWIIIKA